jgi:glycerol uptake facilitator-like aquaporin
MGKRLFAEFFGTFWLVLGGCGAAVLAAAYPTLGIGFVGATSSPQARWGPRCWLGTPLRE